MFPSPSLSMSNVTGLGWGGLKRAGSVPPGNWVMKPLAGEAQLLVARGTPRTLALLQQQRNGECI